MCDLEPFSEIRSHFIFSKWLMLANWPWKFRLSLVQMRERKILDKVNNIVLRIRDFMRQLRVGRFVWHQLTELGTEGSIEYLCMRRLIERYMYNAC